MHEPLPGAIGLSRLRVYDSSGSPHMHLCCSEGYFVVGGEGLVQTLTLAAGFRETPLHAGVVVWFTPGTIHRLINHGDLEICVIMQNSGLPEAGDAVLTFPPAILSNPDTYAAAATLPTPSLALSPGAPASSLVLEAAFARRDLAIEGFAALRDSVLAGDDKPLLAFHVVAASLVQSQLPSWRTRWETGPRRVAMRTGDQLTALASGDASHLADAAVHSFADPAERGRHGMCGLLDTYPIH